MTFSRGFRLGAQSATADIRQELPFLSPLTFHPRVPPITHPSFDGDAFTTDLQTIIQNTSWTPAIPEKAVALLIALKARDSAGAVTTGLHFKIGPTNSDFDALEVAPIGDDAWDNNMGIVPAVAGDIWYQVTASGAGTMDVIMKCWGYWT